VTTLTWILVAIVAAGAGLGGGVLLGRGQQTPDQGAETAQAIADQTLAISELAEKVGAPVTLDAETRQALAVDGLAGCADPSASLTLPCVWDRCVSVLQSDAGRAEGCSQLLEDVRLRAIVGACQAEPGGPIDWACVSAWTEAGRELD
tara:strand:+ start:318 stop:761 length:444 start_codon:yes stop_codon:yes gene_type:complete